MSRKLLVILWKNLIIRKRHWFLTIIEVLMPMVLFTLIAYGRSKISGMSKTEIKNATYEEPIDISEIKAHLPVGDLKLWYSPYTDFTDEVVRKIQEKFQIRGEEIQDFPSEEELLNSFTKNSSATIAALIFKGNAPNINYDISIYDKYFTWDTDKLFTSMMNVEESGSSKYIYKGFTALQIVVDTALLEVLTGKSNINVNFFIQEFPLPPYTSDSGLSQLFIQFLPLVTVFSFVFICPAVLTRVGEEKRSGTKEFLKMVGMESWMLWLGWFSHSLSTNIVSIVVIIILMKVPFWGVPYPPIEYSDGSVLFVFLLLYCIAAVAFCFLIATIFNNPSIATVFGILIWIFSYFIPQTIVSSDDSIRWMYKILFAIFPNMGLYYGYSAIGVYELRETGIQWSNMFQSGSGGEDDITMGAVFLSFIVETIIFMLCTVYIENVSPGQYGIAKPLSFPLLAVTNWMKSCISNRVEDFKSKTKERMSLSEEDNVAIHINNLRKNYSKHVAVENLSMDIYRKCITVLLGHNGAGKTTTMSILTGMISASSGSVFINGKNINKYTDEVRKDMGLCPQHNLLFPDLTAKEHLQFFGMLRGMSLNEAKISAKDLLKKFVISEDSMASALSGGMKRKLCLGMALIGDPQVLILDEPTSGMDPESRREVWNILLEYKKSKTVLITTHFMEEADVLGDRIAIMAYGKLQCYDTPLHLKNLYNTGYHLSLVTENNASIEAISQRIKKKISTANLLRVHGETVIYLLPLDTKSLYSDLFDDLEKQKNTLGIVNIGLSITTLSDVFLKAKDEMDGNSTSEVDEVQHQETTGLLRSTGYKRILISLILKRWYFFKRKFWWYIPAILVATCIFLATMCLGMTDSRYYDHGGPKLPLHLNVYGKTGVIYGGSEEVSPVVDKMRKYYHEVVVNEKGDGDPFLVKDVSQEIIQRGIENIAYYKRHMIVAAEFNSLKSEDIVVNAMYSRTALHGLPISINLAMNAIIKALLNDSYSITATNAPLKPLFSIHAPSELSKVTVGILWLVLIPVGIFFFLNNFIIFPNSEVSTQFLKIQTMAGVPTVVYWLTNIFCDFLICLIQLIFLFLTMLVVDAIAFDSESFGSSEYRVLIVILLICSLTSLPFTYLFSYRKTMSGGMTLLIIFGMFTGIIPTLVVQAMESSGDDYYMGIARYLKHTFAYVFPQFSLSYIPLKFSQKYVENFNWLHMASNKKKHICDSEPNPCCYGDDTRECESYKSYFCNKKLGISNDIAETSVSFCIYLAVLWFLNTLWFEKLLHHLKYWRNFINCCQNNSQSKAKQPRTETDGLELTSVEVGQETSENNRLCARNLTKSFGNKNIVNNLELTLKRQKCFGLLGVNGAGKSTTFRMLTKAIFFDKGEITMLLNKSQEQQDDKDTKTSVTVYEPEYSKKLGYCPQEDYLNYFLTGRELLRSLSLIKGYSITDSEKIINYLLDLFDISDYADKPCLEYSGGNKRKLCSCIAFLGFPSVILLDEPTNGVDPASRRNFWNILSDYKKNHNASFLLCSHSMEECEALCDEIGIMKNGQIKDQGTLATLKNRHQKGYTIEVKLKRDDPTKNTIIVNYLENEINAVLKESYSGVLKFYVEDTNKTLSILFKIMEELKGTHGDYVDDYAINQISLEEIFLRIAKDN